jgi:hypothetical protein
MVRNSKRTPRIIEILYIGVALALTTLVFVGSALSFGQDNGTGVNLGIIGSLGLYPVLPEEGDDVVIGVLVGNRGVKDVRDVSVYFYEDDVYFEKVTVDILAGDTTYVEANWTADSGDSHISVVVDPAGDFTEDKRDNSASTWVTVR